MEPNTTVTDSAISIVFTRNSTAPLSKQCNEHTDWRYEESPCRVAKVLQIVKEVSAFNGTIRFPRANNWFVF